MLPTLQDVVKLDPVATAAGWPVQFKARANDEAGLGATGGRVTPQSKGNEVEALCSSAPSHPDEMAVTCTW